MLFITGVYKINYVIFQIIVIVSFKIFDLLSFFGNRLENVLVKFYQRLLAIYVLCLLDRTQSFLFFPLRTLWIVYEALCFFSSCYEATLQ